jgi:hypothetical protein
MGLFDFFKKKPAPTPPPVQEQETKKEKETIWDRVKNSFEPTEEQKEQEKKRQAEREAYYSSDEWKKDQERLKIPIQEQIRNLAENGSDGSDKYVGKFEGMHIGEFNKFFNSYRDLVTRILSERGILYDDTLANYLADYIEENGINEDYIYGIKDKKSYFMQWYGNFETLPPTYNPNQPEVQAQTRLEAFEYDLIINNETNKYRVIEILEALKELNNIIFENYPIYKLFINRVGLTNPLDGLMESVLDHKMSMEDMAQYTEFIKLLNQILEFRIQLVESSKFRHNTIYQNLALFHHENPYEIGHKVGYDKIYLSTALILFCYLKRDEILEVFYSRASKGVTIQDKAREAHTYIIGASKSGKSELIKDLIFTDFQRGNKSVILIEPHGDLAEQVAKLKGKDNKNLV